MTRIGSSDQGPVGQGGPGSSGDDRLQSGHQPYARSDARTATFDGKQRPGGRVATLAESADRAAAFQKSIATAELKAKGEAAPAEPREARLDSIAAAFGWRGAEPGAVPVQAAAGSTPAAAPSPADAVVASIVERIEQAVKAELFATAGRPSAIQLDLGGLIAGLKSLAIVMTDGMLDVTLVRGEGQATEELALAAQTLAERLQHRFGKRIVRVLDSVEEGNAAADEPGTLQAISRILGNAAAKS